MVYLIPIYFYMVITLNLLLLLKLLLLPLIYIIVLYLSAPTKTLSLKVLILCFLGGILSTNFVQIYYALFDIIPTNYFEQYFFSVAPREEISKLTTFLLVIFLLKKRNLTPVSLMYYSGVIGLGFATFENFMYGSAYGEDIIVARSFTATLGHLIFGLFLGYWVGLGNIDSNKYRNRSLFSSYVQRHKKIKMIVYTLITKGIANEVKGGSSMDFASENGFETDDGAIKLWNEAIDIYDKEVNAVGLNK